MLASLPLDSKNNVMLELLPLYQWWSQHPVCMLEFFQFLDVFQNICICMQKCQKEEFDLTLDELSLCQKTWLFQERVYNAQAYCWD